MLKRDPTARKVVLGTVTLISRVEPRLVAPTGRMFPNTELLAIVVLITPLGPPFAIVSAPPIFSVFVPSEKAKAFAAPVMVEDTPA